MIDVSSAECCVYKMFFRKGKYMKVNKMAVIAMCLISALCISGCNDKQSVSQSDVVNSSKSDIKVYNKTFTTVVTDIVTESTISAEKIKYLVPDIEQNLSDDKDLSIVVINGYEIDIDNINIDIFLKMSGLRKSSEGKMLIDTNLYYFSSGMYCLDENDGTQVSVELTDKDGNLVEPKEQGNYKPADLWIKGISSSGSSTREDFKVQHFGGVCVGMKKDVLVAIMGNGTIVEDKTIYKNKSYTMVVSFAYKPDESGNTVQLVDQITVVKN